MRRQRQHNGGRVGFRRALERLRAATANIPGRSPFAKDQLRDGRSNCSGRCFVQSRGMDCSV